ncbi:hypothetical protein [Chitinophaga sp. OAE865]|uniref:hypothetical protein n=1 Tax=Chitinophaga sp. OAE865 TaxID=2817898 RepID=UPI001AE88F7E
MTNKKTLQKNMSKETNHNLLTNPGNMLFDLHKMLTDLPVRFREQITRECGLSTPTHYRYLQPSVRIVNGEKSHVIQSFSNAEKHMIRKVYAELFKFHGLSRGLYGAE